MQCLIDKFKIIGVQDQSFFFLGGGGHLHFWSVFFPNPRQRWNIAGGLVHFYSPCRKLFYILESVLGIHEILQVILAKIIDEQKKKHPKTKQKQKQTQKKLNLPEFLQSLPKFGWIWPPQFCLKFAWNLPKFLHRQNIVFFGGA